MPNSPAMARTGTLESGANYVFSAQSATGDVKIQIEIEAKRFGLTSGVIGVDGGPSVNVKQLTFP